MSDVAHPFMGKVYVGAMTAIGTLREKYDGFLLGHETIEAEFKGIRDGMLFTTHRIVVLNSQGLTGRKVEVSSFPWRAITAFSLENSGTLDLDAELKICGSGWGVCEVQLGRGTDVRAMAQYLNGKLFG